MEEQTTGAADVFLPPTLKVIPAPDEEPEEDQFVPPPGRRLAPVGGNEKEKEDDDCFKAFAAERAGKDSPNKKAAMAAEEGDEADVDGDSLKEKLRRMEDEQEELNSSLMAMTSHFAKV